MKKGILASVLIALIFLSSISLISCRKTTQIHLHDRHVLSYDLVKNYAEEHGAVNLILLDYHHDIRPEYEVINSVDWVGKLVEEDYVKKVIWLSGKKLLLPNRNARMAWLERSLKNTYPDTADKMRNAVQLVDWYDLQELKFGGSRGVASADISGPFVITLDFDVFTKDPGNPPELFVDELCNWIQKQKPELLTMCLSASYQPDPENAWRWLNRFITGYKRSADWYLESGDFGEKEESRDDFEAHKKWAELPEVYKNAEAPFYSGGYLWQNAPAFLTKSLIEKKINAGNETAKEILYIWNDKKLKSMKQTFNEEKLHEMAALAKSTMHQFFEGKDFYAPNQNILTDKENYGVAVRFRNSEEDRGCLSLYTGIIYEDMEKAVQYCTKEALVDPRYTNIRQEEEKSLITNISVFSDWESMNSCYDFTPGLHSLLLEDSTGEKTLLQAAIALERNYSCEAFLSRLSNKAGLGFDGWKDEGLKFYKARTITYSAFEL